MHPGQRKNAATALPAAECFKGERSAGSAATGRKASRSGKTDRPTTARLGETRTTHGHLPHQARQRGQLGSGLGDFGHQRPLLGRWAQLGPDVQVIVGPQVAARDLAGGGAFDGYAALDRRDARACRPLRHQNRGHTNG